MEMDPAVVSRLSMVDTRFNELGDLLKELSEKYTKLQFCLRNNRANECGILEEECFYLIKDANQKAEPIPHPKITGLRQI